jgi:hypothetical protein
MTESIPRKIIGEIFKNFSLKELIKKEIVCKSFQNIIRSTIWNQFVVKLRDIDMIEYVVKNYKFTKYDLCYLLITDDMVKLFVNCHTLDLSYCYEMTDASVKSLGNCHTLNLSYCSQITDERNYNKQSLL